MNVKRYTAPTLAEAMEQVKQELGGDALILSQRTVKKGFFKKEHEVMAAYEKPAESAQSKKGKNFPPLSKGVPPATNAKASAYAKTAKPAGDNPLKDNPPPLVSTRRREASPEPANAAERALEILDQINAKTEPMPAASPILPKEPSGEFQPLHIHVAEPKSEPKEHIIGRPAQAGELAGQGMEQLQNRIDILTSSVNSLVGKMQLGNETRSYSPEIDAMMLSLLENEAHEEFISRIAKEVDEIVTKQREEPREVMEQLLRQYLGTAEPIRLKRFKRTVVLLAGPTGGGKTTTLAKLAAIYSINHHSKVGVITTDTYRIAAVEQLKTYTQILEIPLSIVYTPAEVADALKDHEDKDVVFIDTAGKSPSDQTHEEELTELIKHSECDEVHLVVSATTGFTGLLNILNAYSFLTDFKLIITKLDETPAWGGVLNARFLTDKSLSYTAIGQNVPDDIEVADIRKIVTRLIG